MLKDEDLRGKTAEELQVMLERIRQDRKQKPEARKTPAKKAVKEKPTQITIEMLEGITLGDIFDD